MGGVVCRGGNCCNWPEAVWTGSHIKAESGGKYRGGAGPRGPHQTTACYAEALGPLGARGAIQHAAEAMVEGMALSQAVEVTQVGC